MSSCVLRVVVGDTKVHKLTLTEQLVALVQENCHLSGSHTLMYMDKDFNDEYFTLTSTDVIKDKDTIKIVEVEEPFFTLNFTPINHSTPSSAAHKEVVAGVSSLSSSPETPEDGASACSSDTTILPKSPSYCSQKWPANFDIPTFPFNVELILQAGNEAYEKNGTLLNNPTVNSEILETLADAMFSFTAYPSGLQILGVVQALMKKYPCLLEPTTSYSGLYGWQQRLKYKMNNFRTKLRKQEVPCPELEINSLKRKAPGHKAPAKNCKRPKCAEINCLPPLPNGETNETLEVLRKELQEDVKKKNNNRIIHKKMAQTFSSRRLEVVTGNSTAEEFKERWPALFTETGIKEEFKRITTMSLVQTLMSNLDRYALKLVTLMRTKGGVIGTKLRPLLVQIDQHQSIEVKRDLVIRGLILYLGEKEEEVFSQTNADSFQDVWEHVLKIMVCNPQVEDAVDVSIILDSRLR